MVDTGKVVGFYTDVFGNEIDEYEQIEKYTVSYKGQLFMDDKEGWNSVGYDRWDDAISLYHAYEELMEIYITDNEYGCTFANGEWY